MTEKRYTHIDWLCHIKITPSKEDMAILDRLAKQNSIQNDPKLLTLAKRLQETARKDGIILSDEQARNIAFEAMEMFGLNWL